MITTYTKSRVVDGEVILLRTDKSEVSKGEQLESLNVKKEDLEEALANEQRELSAVIALIADIANITVDTVEPTPE